MLSATLLAFAGVLAAPAFADVTGVGTGATVSVSSGTPITINPFGPGFAASVVSDTLTANYSTIAFKYVAPENFGSGERLILQVFNGTGHAIDHINFTIWGVRNTAFQLYPGGGTFDIPSEGNYSSGTYNATAGLAADFNISTYRNLTVPLTLGVNDEQDFFIGVIYNTPGDHPADFTLSQSVPEPSIASIYGSFAVGLIGLLAVMRRRKIA